MDFLFFTLFGSVALFWCALALMFILFILSERFNNGFISFVSVIVFYFLARYWSDIPLDSLETSNLIKYGGLYLFLGFIFATIRTYFYGRAERTEKYTSLETLKNKLKGKVGRWWLNWPFSLIHWVVSDIFRDLYDLLYEKCAKFFEHVLALGFGPEEPKNDSKTNA